MPSDFLNKVAKDADRVIKSTSSSPYRLKKEGSKTAQIRTNTYKTVKLIAFQEDRKMIDFFHHTRTQRNTEFFKFFLCVPLRPLW